MTLTEVKQIAVLISLYYPAWKPANEQLLAAAWYKALEHDDYAAIELGLRRYVRTNKSGFAPSPGQLIDCWEQIKKEKAADDMERRMLSATYGWHLPEKTWEDYLVPKQHFNGGVGSRRLIDGNA